MLWCSVGMPPTPRLHPDDAAVVDGFVHHTVAVAGRSQSTAARRRSNLGRFLTWCRRYELDAQALAVDDVRTFLDHERARGLSANAVAAVQDTIRAFYDHAYPDRTNPARAFPLPDVGPRTLRPYEPDERDAILDRLRRGKGIGARFDLAVVAALAGTGIRRSSSSRFGPLTSISTRGRCSCVTGRPGTAACRCQRPRPRC